MNFYNSKQVLKLSKSSIEVSSQKGQTNVFIAAWTSSKLFLQVANAVKKKKTPAS
jgi:hypothetical protein